MRQLMHLQVKAEWEIEFSQGVLAGGGVHGYSERMMSFYHGILAYEQGGMVNI